MLHQSGSANDSNSVTKLPAVILAGSPPDPEIQARYSVSQRAAVPIAGKMMVEYIVDALAGASRIGRVRLVGDVQCENVFETVAPRESMIENLIAGMAATCSTGGDTHVLVSTSDIPMLTSASIDDFVERCGDLTYDFYYPIIAREDAERQFSGMRRTYARLADGTFTGGNIVLMRAGFVTENADVIRSVFNARKSVMQLAGLIGIGTLLRAVVAQVIWPGALNLAAIEKTAGRLLHARVKAVQTPYAEIGADADDIEQIESIKHMLASEKVN